MPFPTGVPFEPSMGTLKMRDMNCGKRFSEQLSITGTPKRYCSRGEFQAVIVDNSCWIAVHNKGLLLTATTAQTATTTTLPCPTPTARPKVRSTPHQTRHRRQTPTTARCVCWRLEPSNRASVLLVPTVCVTRDAVVLYAVRISLSSWICTQELTVKLN